MTKAQSMTTGAIKARERRAARNADKSTSKGQGATPVTPALTVTFTPEFQTRLDELQSHAAECGRLDCGHLGKSPSLAVRRAVILYTAEGSGRFTVSLDGEAPEVAAVVGLLRSARHAHPVYSRTGKRGGMVQTTQGVATLWPNADGIKVTSQRHEVFTYMLQGYSATDISSDPTKVDRTTGKVVGRKGLTPRNIETVKSHAGYLRRLTNAHDSVSALLSLVAAGKLTDKALTPSV